LKLDTEEAETVIVLEMSEGNGRFGLREYRIYVADLMGFR
jgi:hypothetical protein